MFSSLFRAKRRRTRSQKSASRAFSTPSLHRHALSDENAVFDDNDSGNEYDDDGGALAEEEDGADDFEETPLLPLFSAAHLDSLPVYNLTHTIRLLIIQRCETTLSWEQLRSPQISQFLVKPIQSQVRSSHFSRATLYALLSNYLQFNKESRINPGNVGVLATRGRIAELIAIRLLKDFSSRELIDALSYDFDPLNGMTPPTTSGNANVNPSKSRAYGGSLQYPAAARISCLEIAIKAQAKRFLAHPLVVQHLEAIWAGTIVFHSAQDDLHRYPTKPPISHNRQYGATHDGTQGANESNATSHGEQLAIRRSVTVYNPSSASVFKLSRLRVPRYRNIFSTLSFAVMLSLYIAVLVERSRDISALEVLFWLWSAAFMLDELVGFSEQGFGLYIMSVWNSFDIGILLFFVLYYVMRLYGLIIADDSKQYVASLAYDVLATAAVLLFPRLFSLLDHYRYFSQLLIAFRLMAQDLAAVFVLIVISCSGFFVAFTLSFASEESNGAIVVYDLFQILMGYTPAAWTKWDEYNVLGKIIMSVFLIVCHFLVVTILITVLTNSFMAIVKNANEEHQFLFAVNTISMVKSDALFSYVAPTNIIGWVISPLRHFIPLRVFVKVNRTIIKVTHFPILVSIFAYEKLRMSSFNFTDPTELVERRGRQPMRLPTFALNADETDLFSPGARVREPSMMTVQKDRALDEVFRRPFRGGSTMRKISESNNGRPGVVVDKWMNTMGNEGGASPPLEQPRAILEHLETNRPKVRKSRTSQVLGSRNRESFSVSQSQLSEPEEPSYFNRGLRPTTLLKQRSSTSMDADEYHITGADGDDELVTNEEDSNPKAGPEKENLTTIAEYIGGSVGSSKGRSSPTVQGPSSMSSAKPFGEMPSNPAVNFRPGAKMRRQHDRNSSTNTIVFKPLHDRQDSSTSPGPRASKAARRQSPVPPGGVQPGQGSPRRPPQAVASQPRPAMPSRIFRRTAPNVAQAFEDRPAFRKRAPSFDTIALGLASDIGDNHHLAAEDEGVGFVGGSFQTQMAMAMRQRRSHEESSMVNRIMLARMNHLEEGFKDILKEVKEWRNASSRGTSAGEESSGGRRLARRLDKKARAMALAEQQAPLAESVQQPPSSDVTRQPQAGDEAPTSAKSAKDTES